MSIQHILAPFQSSNESAWIGIDLAEELQQKGLTPALWSTEIPHPVFVQYGINAIRPYQGKIPANDALIVIGTDVAIGNWYESSQFESITLLNHKFKPSGFNRIMHRLTMQGIKQVELQYTNLQLSEKIGLPGRLIELPFNPDRVFKKEVEPKRAQVGFALGVMTSDDISHHHPDDIALYQRLADSRVSVKIYGGICLKQWLGGIKNIELLAQVDNSHLGEILPLLDCIYFNNPPTLTEGPSQCMMAAIHMKLPIIAFAGGGYAQTLKQYRQGILFYNQQEAFVSIKNLLNNHRPLVPPLDKPPVI